MANILRSYKKHVAEGKTFLVIAIIFAVAIRLGYFFYFDFPLPAASGYFSGLFSIIFEKPLLSMLASAAITGGMAFLATHINTEYVFIRRRTLLPAAFVILLFSCSPQFIYITPEYIGAILFLYAVNILFKSYNSDAKQQVSYKVSFIISLGSLVAPVLLLYIPVMWIALSAARSFNFKAFLTSLIGVFIIYFPAFSFFLFTDRLEVFLSPFLSVTADALKSLPFFGFEVFQWGILGLSVIMLIIIISDNYINRHKDKIRIRAYLGIFDFIIVVAILLFVFLNIGSGMHLFIALISGSFLLAHFYALAERKISVWLFYLFCVFYLLICFSPFLSL